MIIFQVIIYSWILASFAVGVYGSLIYAVFKVGNGVIFALLDVNPQFIHHPRQLKEKRIFTMPFLVFQVRNSTQVLIIIIITLFKAVFITLAGVILFIFMLCAMFSRWAVPCSTIPTSIYPDREL